MATKGTVLGVIANMVTLTVDGSAVLHNDVLVVHQTHALHEVITELRPVRIGHACTFFH